ncbi:Holliday junction branch migration protein RuvA [Rothia sp. HSID18069]|uniref:Holliday junction branch migration complex subunit RuvA n=1 Tax=Rothia aeria F0474 TaxID=1125724 RepID=I0UVS7_9MICC|nr:MULTISPECIES: Holliday junction branch migration protein RuvA [Rothia]EID51980.1 Holliday junction DNA helicase RuvA [Rothia aeria F0474]OXT12126.1 Holliday junction branch migration protein RuvA [Rothia sp. Olga]QXW93428.1 Holliday junction branch migration protein RuvA [Rothia aeria]RUP73453.1 Holliday junction branch migration protein RuvA [Rothia sp. HSID18069]
MIASLTGRVSHVGLDSVILDVNGFGMLVHATARTLASLHLGETATVLTSMIVREESMTLYGFAEPAEREVFDMMLSVSGIGPRIALAVLSVHTASEVERAVATGDDKAFTKVPGIGPKGARRIVLELAGKLILSESQGEEAAAPQSGLVWKPQVLDALTSLGWTEKDANAAIDAYVTHNPGAENEAVGAALRGVLASLGAQNTVGRR